MTEIDDLAARLRRLEDEREIARLIASYGPAVVAGDADAAARLWATDGSYDVEGCQMNSQDDVHAMVGSASHQNLVANGCCHFVGRSVMTVTEDSAVAVAESLVLVRDGESYRVWRSTANHFELQRIEGRWRITKRTRRVLDGDPGARALLTAAPRTRLRRRWARGRSEGLSAGASKPPRDARSRQIRLIRGVASGGS